MSVEKQGGLPIPAASSLETEQGVYGRSARRVRSLGKSLVRGVNGTWGGLRAEEDRHLFDRIGGHEFAAGGPGDCM